MKRLVLSAMLCAVPLLAADMRLLPSRDGATLTFARASAPASVHVALRFDPDKPADARLTLHALDSGESAALTLDVTPVRTLAVAPGWYELSVAMPHHREAKRTFQAAGEHVALGSIAIPRAPVISGIVRRGSAPLAGARVTSGKGGSVLTSAAGKFELEVTGEWPSEVSIRAQGLGTKFVPIAAAEASVTLPPADLTPAASIRVTVDRNTFGGPLDVSLGIH